MTLEVFLKQVYKHAASPGTKSHLTPSSLSPATVSALAVLSSMTLGQPRLAGEVLCEAVAMRLEKDKDDAKDPVPCVDDVKIAVELVYERAGVVPAKLTKAKGAKTKDRKRAKGRGKNGGISTAS